MGGSPCRRSGQLAQAAPKVQPVGRHGLPVPPSCLSLCKHWRGLLALLFHASGLHQAPPTATQKTCSLGPATVMPVPESSAASRRMAYTYGPSANDGGPLLDCARAGEASCGRARVGDDSTGLKKKRRTTQILLYLLLACGARTILRMKKQP